jgi:hypothetical protein
LYKGKGEREKWEGEEGGRREGEEGRGRRGRGEGKGEKKRGKGDMKHTI